MNIFEDFLSQSVFSWLLRFGRVQRDLVVECGGVGVFGVVDAGVIGEDVVSHGPVHGHGDAGLMVYGGGVVVSVDYDGVFPAVVFTAVDGGVVGAVVVLDPYSDVADSVLSGAGHSDGHSHGHSDGHSHGHSHGHSDGHSHGHSDGHSDGHSHGHSHGHGDGHGGFVEGWTAPVRFSVGGGGLIVGDPGSVLDYGVDEARVFFGESVDGDSVDCSVYVEGGVRRFLVCAVNA